MKILITGINGYIGKSLCYNLEGYNITGINRKICDLSNSTEVDAFFKDKYFDVIIHCAASGGSRLKKDNDNIFKNNIKMFENLLFKKDHYGKFIHFGSGAQYNYPLTPYGLSKKLISDMIFDLPNFYNIIIWGVFDENELNTRFIKANTLKCINDEPMVIHKDKYMDFFHMKDLNVVKQYIEGKNTSKIYECKYRETYRLTHIAEMIALILGKTSKIQLKEEGLDKPYISQDRSMYVTENFENRLKETVNILNGKN